MDYFLDINCLIIPEEVPTILSLIYSNIPPIKKGIILFDFHIYFCISLRQRKCQTFTLVI